MVICMWVAGGQALTLHFIGQFYLNPKTPELTDLASLAGQIAAGILFL